jgi:hypothetical protein
MKPIGILAAINMRASATGKPRRFNILAYSGGALSVDGFDLPVIVDLSGLDVPETPLPILIDHTKSVEATLGMTDSVENTGTALVLAGPVTGASAIAQQVIAQADAGHQWQASIGAMVVDSERVAPGQSVQVNGQTFVGPVIVARRATLRETSVLPMGADASTVVNLAASAAAMKGALPMSFEDWLKSLGLDPATIDETYKAALQLAYDAQQAPATPAAAAPAAVPAATPVAPAVAAAATVDLTASINTMLTAQRKALADDQVRIAQIQAKCAGHPLICAKAVSEGWTVDKAELEVLRASQGRTTATSFRNGDKSQPSDKVIEAALCQARGLKDAEKNFAPEVLQAAQSTYRGRIGLRQAVMLAAAANGAYVTPGQREVTREILAAACCQGLQAAASTVSLPGILSNVANKEILEGYMEEDNAWSEIAAIKSVSDFRTVTSYRMLDEMEYEQLGPDGKIKHGTTGEESYTRSADTYAKMFALTRRDLINDDIGAFEDLRNRIGRGSAKKLAKVFWTAFVNNSTFFTSARTNYISGATTNLATDGVGLGLGVTGFRKMTSPSADGTKRVGAGMRPEILLVPPELEFTADALFSNQNLGAVATSSANVFANRYRPVVAWQLSDSAYTGYSTTAWYLLTNPSAMPTVIVSFLNGQQTPTIETADADFNTLGIQFRGYHDFGVDMAEYLGGLKSKGAA